jgi:peroxiredoxin
MRRILTIAILGLLLIHCKQENRTGYVINGNAKEVYNGVRVYLKSVDNQGRQIVNDTAIVINGAFKMNGTIDEPSVRFLAVDGAQGELIFMLENSDITIDIDKTVLMKSKVTGSETNNDFRTFQDEMERMAEANKDLIIHYRTAINNKELRKKDSIRTILEKYSEQISGYPLKYLNENNDTYFSLNLLGLEINNPKIDLKAYIEAFNNLTPRLKETPKGKEISAKLDELYKEYQKIAHLEVGKLAPNFEAPTPDGKMVSLDDLKGKVTIIDFWAAWCGPCRKENPNVVRIYNKFHDQGLEIIGVSLDGNGRQNDPKKSWLDAIEKDNLVWTQVSNLQYFNDPVARLYNISSIPATFILDKDGKIAYKNLRGKALELKVQELLQQ